MRLDRASPCGPVWPCVALWPGGERGPSAQWPRPAEARGSLEHDVALSRERPPERQLADV